MNIPLSGLPLSESLPDKLKNGQLKNKRILLVDTSATMRDRRAESLRKLGMEVDCAADISEARTWWRPDVYTLVLIDMEGGLGDRDKFCDDMRRATPPQLISFLVGKPAYLADAPAAERVSPVQRSGDQVPWGDVKAALAAELPGEVSQRWGILEASRRISAVRSLSHSRSKITEEKPVPPRDLEIREVKRVAAESRTLDDLLREELQ